MKNEILSYFLPVSRKFFDHPFWKDERSYSRAEAWLDLIASARFEDSAATGIIGNVELSWTRGQLPATLRYLSERWKWSKSKVNDFLKLLQKLKMIERSKVNGLTVLSLTNYELYNRKIQKEQVEEPAQSETDNATNAEPNKRKTQKRQRKDKTNIVNKENKVKNRFSGAAAPTHSQEDQAGFSRFETWILENAPRVAEMNQPFTIDQYIRLREKLPVDQIKDLLQRMGNYAPLTKKNESAYLTVINWAKRDFNQLKTTNNATSATEQYLKERERLAEQVRKRAEE
ncbi:hypothetical protein SAMN05518672_108149 [Chitinophaga sp. CF118]|uniref:hypothetical protein n=1 Tax=Chitinophaga sp. CF118 TaxID=1884367 RepID=UPI0008E5B548|nr:hypothetical protein [Chitinophaga sp. CF118]SFE62574.1 hypothetical protein SAMN05518672_108149 [Chitinophaga sp. CF118]